MLSRLFAYRSYVWRNACNDLRYRYAGSGIGVYWNVINPLSQVAVYFVVFGVLLAPARPQAEGPYALYLCAGLLPWLSFAEGLTRGSQSIAGNAGLLRSLSVPAEAFVAQTSLTSVFGLLITLVLLVVVGSFVGEPPGFQLLLLPVVAVLLHGLAFGISLALASLRVFFADVGEILRVVTQLWMWSLPVVYRQSLIPPRFLPWLRLNPPYVFLRAFRSILLNQNTVSAADWALMVGWVVVAVAVGGTLAHWLESDVRDAL